MFELIKITTKYFHESEVMSIAVNKETLGLLLALFTVLVILKGIIGLIKGVHQ